MTKLALFSRYGTEIRHLVNEGTRVQVNGATLLHTVQQSIHLREYAAEFHLDLKHISNISESFNRWGSYFHASRMARNRLKHFENYKHLSTAHNEPNFLDLLKGNSFSYWIFDCLYRHSYSNYINHEVKELLRNMPITEFWLADHSSPVNLAMAVTAKAAGCRTVCYIHSWKDFYINNYVPSAIDELRVWSSLMRDQFLASNPHLKEKQVVVAGNPRMSALHNHKVVYDIAYYKDKYGIHSDSFILYTAINPRVYEHEPELLKLVIAQLKSDLGNDMPSILIKPNPMDSSPSRWNELANLPDVGVIDSGWEWNSTENFNLPSLAAEIEWFDLLNHCKCTMNVASTVAVESLICGKPVINIGFDHLGKPSAIFERITQAPFYRPLLSREDVMLLTMPDQITHSYERALTVVTGQNLESLITL